MRKDKAKAETPTQRLVFGWQTRASVFVSPAKVLESVSGKSTSLLGCSGNELEPQEISDCELLYRGPWSFSRRQRLLRSARMRFCC